jgi:hypothetical protein
LKGNLQGIIGHGLGDSNNRKEGREAMRIIECIIEKAVDLAGSEAFTALLIRVSSLYKYASFFV